MALETYKAQLQIKDSEGKVIKDSEGNPTYTSIEVDYNFGDNLEQAIEYCEGEDHVFNLYKIAARNALMGILRTGLASKDPSPEAILKRVEAWIPGKPQRKASDPKPLTKEEIVKMYKTWDEDKRAQLLAMLSDES